MESNTKGVSIFLAFFYAAVSIMAQTLTVLPDTSEAEFRLGIFVPALSAIIYGPMAGGTTAGLGNVLIDMYAVMTGDLDTFTLDRLFGGLANFVGGYVTGWLAKKLRSEHNYIRLRDIFGYMIATSVGIAILTGLQIGYGILYLYLNVPLDVAFQVFYSIAFYNTAVLMVMLPISLVTYIIFNRIQVGRFNSRDRKSRVLTLTKSKSEVDVVRVDLPEHSLWINEWTPVEVEVRNNNKSPTSFTFELSTDALAFPQTDRSPKVAPGKRFVQTFYLMPKTKGNIRLRLHVNDGQKSTVMGGEAPTLNVYKQDSLAGFSSVNVLVFVLSVLWSSFLESFNETIQFTQDNLIMIITVLGAEIVIFIIAIIINNRRYRRRLASFMNLDIALPTDHSSYQISEAGQVERPAGKKGNKLAQVILRLSGIAVLAAIVVDGFEFVFAEGYDLLDQTTTLLLVLVSLLMALLSEVVFSPDPKVLGDDPVVQGVVPATPFKQGIPTEVSITVNNTIEGRGLRVVLNAPGFISPQVVELDMQKGEQVVFKVILTPLEAGTQNLLVTFYPLFQNGKRLSLEESEPIHHKIITFEVLESTVLGMTNEQFDFLKNAAGAGSIIAGALLTVNEFVGIDNIILRFRNSLPIIIILQLPIIYMYFFASNRFSGSLRS